METYKRVFVIVLDSLGIGAMPDSEKFGDKGVDTFGHILDKMGTLDIPNLQKLGMLNLHKGGVRWKAWKIRLAAICELGRPAMERIQ